jgi:hypothetical protein
LFSINGQPAACSGTIVGNGVVLTAQHCFEQLPANTQITLEMVTPLANGATSVSQATSTNWLMKGPAAQRTSDNDLAVVFFDLTQLPCTSPQIPQPTGSAVLTASDVGGTVTIVGFDGSPLDAPVRQQGTTTISQITNGTIFTNPGAGQSSTQLGDSGGPLLVNRNGTEYIAGVISGLCDNVACTTPQSYYTRVDSGDNYGFVVYATLMQQQKCGGPPTCSYSATPPSHGARSVIWSLLGLLLCLVVRRAART